VINILLLFSEEHLDIWRRKQRVGGDNLVMERSIIFTSYQIILQDDEMMVHVDTDIG
jgi:hypothetical protein